jgi:hypothetical protein
VDALAAQVEKLTLQMASLVQGRRFGNARQAALPDHDSKPAAYSALGAQLPPTYDLAPDWQVVDTSIPAYVSVSHRHFLQGTQANDSHAPKHAADLQHTALKVPSAQCRRPLKTRSTKSGARSMMLTAHRRRRRRKDESGPKSCWMLGRSGIITVKRQDE